MDTQKDYLNSQVVRPLRQQPEAPRNIFDLSDKQPLITDFTQDNESGLTDTLCFDDDVIPQVNKSKVPHNNFVRKMDEQFELELLDTKSEEGADSHDDEQKVEQHPVSQSQPGGDRGQSHHGSFKRSALKPVRDIRRIGRIINYEDGISIK
jgi:hypothetical protein